jgi:hypothetical protein
MSQRRHGVSLNRFVELRLSRFGVLFCDSFLPGRIARHGDHFQQILARTLESRWQEQNQLLHEITGIFRSDK